ncbi:hypothetical protein [Desulfonatronum sp. SC1]|uniref:hypothetical protein n=1 Tax=Desulfonatronum sp. SC1 TaxID=2109626 RepID=UPI000D321252|nr:hypothetical protein [Desulfonatronum sp. SC1]PTN36010.1 hypothetical protein C6366_10725 [Desulfonatronum sp. SC1]
MNEFLEKNWPMLVVAALIVIAVALANMITATNLPGKGLQIKKVDKTPVEAMDIHPQPTIGLLVDGQPAEDPYLTTLVIRNTGNIPIRGRDYDAPLAIEVTNEPTIIQVHYQLLPTDMNIETTLSPKALTIAPTLLNPGDVIILQLFTRGGEPEFNAEAHIEGVRKIYTEETWKVQRWSQSSGMDYLAFLVTLFNVMLFAIILKSSYDSKYVFIRRTTGVILFIAMSVVFLASYFSVLEDLHRPVYASSLLLIGCSLLAFLLAWLVMRRTEIAE